MTASRASTEEEMTRTLVDEVFDEIRAERRAYIEEVGFDRWFDEFRERESAPYPGLEKFLDKAIAELEDRVA